MGSFEVSDTGRKLIASKTVEDVITPLQEVTGRDNKIFFLSNAEKDEVV